MKNLIVILLSIVLTTACVAPRSSVDAKNEKEEVKKEIKVENQVKIITNNYYCPPKKTILNYHLKQRKIFPDKYLVKCGDTLWKISRMNCITLKRIYRLNPEINRCTSLIKIGQLIKIK